jgi:quinol monooxygenase YgiN
VRRRIGGIVSTVQWEDAVVTAMNVVRAVVKPGREEEFLELHRTRELEGYDGMNYMRLVKTGEREYVFVGEWESMEALAAARPAMIASLDKSRDMLEDLGGDLGATDPRSGDVVVERRP